MKFILSTIAAAGLAFVLSAPADATQADPEQIIYRFTGVHDDGGADNNGTATVFFCTNFSGATENLRFVTRDNNANLKTNNAFPINHLQTITATTHANQAYIANLNTNTGNIFQGSTAIAATSTNVFCRAVTVDAANTKPVGVTLPGLRFSPIPGTAE